MEGTLAPSAQCPQHMPPTALWLMTVTQGFWSSSAHHGHPPAGRERRANAGTPWGMPTAAKQSLPQSSCCLWPSWTFGFPANPSRRHNIAPHVVKWGAGYGSPKCKCSHWWVPCWHVLKWRDGENGTFWMLPHIDSLCFPCSFGKPFSSPFQLHFHLQYKNLAHKFSGTETTWSFFF